MLEIDLVEPEDRELLLRSGTLGTAKVSVE